MRVGRILYLSAWHPTWCPVNVSSQPLGWWEWGHSLSTARAGLEAWKPLPWSRQAPCAARWRPTVPWLPEGGAWGLLSRGTRLPLRGLQEGDLLGDGGASPAAQLHQAGCLPRLGWESASARPLPEGALLSGCCEGAGVQSGGGPL